MKNVMGRLQRLLAMLLASSVCFFIQAQKVVSCEQLAANHQELLHEADLVFVVNDAGNAITESTQDHGNWPIDHVAVFHRDSNGMPCVIQAIHQGVCITPLDSLVSDKDVSALIIGRVANVDTTATIKKSLSFVGKPYDFYFAPSDSAIYCSELVQKSFVDRQGHLIFEPIAMSFHSTDGRILPYWTEHYNRIGSRVPEGAPGTNPAELSRRPQVALLYLVKAL